ncbi:unnamed protein product [Dibothriocephalus latus]|uniref:Uncharacterized protein n=1 Tax=Dibothriocephalus latus TaxID=60516 RepID=A0A3P6PFZ0_DIBLA|nr:unnamed protein product [Dibothriocephalus latus]
MLKLRLPTEQPAPQMSFRMSRNSPALLSTATRENRTPVGRAKKAQNSSLLC